MHVQLQFGRNAKPHGKEWKRIFRELMLPLLNPDIFPDEILRALAKHMRNPKASSQSDSNLVKIMRGYDVKQFIGSYLEDVVEGEQFLFNKRQFKKLQKKRTRAEPGRFAWIYIPEESILLPNQLRLVKSKQGQYAGRSQY